MAERPEYDPWRLQDGAWRFDAAAGRNEILHRRIGRNELNAIQVGLAYVDAQQEYADMGGTEGKTAGYLY
jgi:hypothetical protein